MNMKVDKIKRQKTKQSHSEAITPKAISILDENDREIRNDGLRWLGGNAARSGDGEENSWAEPRSHTCESGARGAEKTGDWKENGKDEN